MIKFRILVVDDEDDIRLILKTTLGIQFEVVEASNGLDALEKLDRVEPDFVVLDIMMPLMNGFDACSAIRKHPKFSRIGVYFLSAKTDREGIQKGYELGANLYLQKPFDPMRLLKNIEFYFKDNDLKPLPKRHTLEQLKAIEKQPRAEDSKSKPVGAILRPGYLSPKQQVQPKPIIPKSLTPPKFPEGIPRILAVSGDDEFLMSLYWLLKKDYEIIIENQATGAIESIVNSQPELILLELQMPGLDSIKLTQLIKQNQNLNYIELIFISDTTIGDMSPIPEKISGNPPLIKNSENNQILETISSVCYKPTFQVYKKRTIYDSIPQETFQRINQAKEAERKKKEREYFKMKHQPLQNLFEGMNKKVQDKQDKKDNK